MSRLPHFTLSFLLPSHEVQPGESCRKLFLATLSRIQFHADTCKEQSLFLRDPESP